MKPLAFDICAGLGGWTDGLLAEGWNVIGIDIERRPYPAQLWLQDIRTIHGSQLRHADVIVASPPCIEYSYMAMPWQRGKQIALAIRNNSRSTGMRAADFPEGYSGSRNTAQLNALFDTCFRIQREASEAAGRYIPMVVENVKGAQPWVGRARANFGSFYLWGDVDSIGGRIVRRGDIRWGVQSVKAATCGQKFNPDGTEHGQGSWFAIADSQNRGTKLPGNNSPRLWSEREVQRLADAPLNGTKNDGGSWFNVAHNTESGLGNNPDGRKVTGDWFGSYADMKDAGTISPGRLHGKNSPKRKQASAKIAMIPLPLSTHIARIFKPGADCTGMGMKSCSDAM